MKAKEPVPFVEIKVQPNPLLDLIEKELRPFNRDQYFDAIRVFPPWYKVDVRAKLAERAAATTAFKEKTQAEISALRARAASPEAGIIATLHLICGAHLHASWCLGLIARLDGAFKELDPEGQALAAPLVSLAMTLGEHMKLQSVLESEIVPMAAAFKKRDDAARAGHDISQSEIDQWSERWLNFVASDQRRDRNGNPKTRGRLNAFYKMYADVSDENGRPYSPEKIRLRLERAGHVPARKPHGKKRT